MASGVQFPLLARCQQWLWIKPKESVDLYRTSIQGIMVDFHLRNRPKIPSARPRFGDRVSGPLPGASGKTVVFLDLPSGQPNTTLVVEPLPRIQAQCPSRY